jgi:hypothetical protein
VSRKAPVFGTHNTPPPRHERDLHVLSATSLAGIGVADEDHDDNQPPAPIYLDDGDNYPMFPITPTDDQDHGQITTP